jgi:dienelactone hydrolase
MQPSPGDRWSAAWFAYEVPADLVVVESRPSPRQLNVRQRPDPLPVDQPLVPSKHPVKPVTTAGMQVIHLKFRNTAGQIVPALLCTPLDRDGPYPLVVAVHGLGSNKAQMCGQIAPALVARGFAVLAPDMPLHGERPGNPRQIGDRTQALKTVELHRQAVRDVRLCIDVAERREELDTSSVTLLGYSMGSWINSVAGASDPRVEQMVLMVGGAHDVAAAALLIPQVAAMQPHLALAHFSRPVLLLNARGDQIVTPEMADRLYRAASDPKEQIWFEGGHILPAEAYERAADWLEKQVQPLSSGS